LWVVVLRNDATVEIEMNSLISDWTEWLLTPAAVLVLAALHRLDLVVIVVPLAVLLAYVMCSKDPKQEFTRRKM
jgi:hypothetical protein